MSFRAVACFGFIAALYLTACSKDGEAVTFVDVRFDAVDELKPSAGGLLLTILSEDESVALGPTFEALSGTDLPVSVRVLRGRSERFRVEALLFDTEQTELSRIDVELSHRSESREVLLVFGDPCTDALTCCAEPPCMFPDASRDGKVVDAKSDATKDAGTPDVDATTSDGGVSGPPPLVARIDNYEETVPGAACESKCSVNVAGFELVTPVQPSGHYLVLAQGETSFNFNWRTGVWTGLLVDGLEVATAGYPVHDEEGTARPAHWFLFDFLDATETHSIKLRARMNGPSGADKTYGIDAEVVAIWLPEDQRVLRRRVLDATTADKAAPNSVWKDIVRLSRTDNAVDYLVFAEEYGSHTSTGAATECRSIRLVAGERTIPEVHGSPNAVGTLDANPSTTCGYGYMRGMNAFIAMQRSTDGPELAIQLRNFDDTYNAQVIAYQLVALPVDLFTHFSELGVKEPLAALATGGAWTVSGSWEPLSPTRDSLLLGMAVVSTRSSDFSIRSLSFSAPPYSDTMTHKASFEAGPHVFFSLSDETQPTTVQLSARPVTGALRVSDGLLLGMQLP